MHNVNMLLPLDILLSAFHLNCLCTPHVSEFFFFNHKTVPLYIISISNCLVCLSVPVSFLLSKEKKFMSGYVAKPETNQTMLSWARIVKNEYFKSQNSGLGLDHLYPYVSCMVTIFFSSGDL